MRLVTKDLKCLGCGSGKCSDSRHLLSEGKGRSFSQKANIVRRFHYFVPCSHFSFLDPDAFRSLSPHRKSETCYPSPSLSQLRIPQLLIEIPCPAKTTLREIGKMNLVMRRKCDMEAGERSSHTP